MIDLKSLTYQIIKMHHNIRMLKGGPTYYKINELNCRKDPYVLIQTHGSWLRSRNTFFPIPGILKQSLDPCVCGKKRIRWDCDSIWYYPAEFGPEYLVVIGSVTGSKPDHKFTADLNCVSSIAIRGGLDKPRPARERLSLSRTRLPPSATNTATKANFGTMPVTNLLSSYTSSKPSRLLVNCATHDGHERDNKENDLKRWNVQSSSLTILMTIVPS